MNKEYISKLDAMEYSMSDLDYLYENGVTAELVEAEGTKLARGDDMLNLNKLMEEYYTIE